tara:strand:+ start:5092 stop:5556 length:465 start_codon:yes stop_codon:yes gene_type:complete
MAVKLDNLDEIVNQMARMEKGVDLEAIRLVRKKMYALMRTYKPLAKRASPKDTGALIKSIKVRSRSRRGVTTVKLVWMVPYAGPVNFRKSTKKKVGGALGISVVRETERSNPNEGFASELWEQEKAGLDSKGAAIVKDTMKEVLEKHGVKVENT